MSRVLASVRKSLRWERTFLEAGAGSPLGFGMYWLHTVGCPRTGRRSGKMGCCPIFAVRYLKYEMLPHKSVQRCVCLPAFAFSGLALQCRMFLCLAMLSVLLGFAEKSAQNLSGIVFFSSSMFCMAKAKPQQ